MGTIRDMLRRITDILASMRAKQHRSPSTLLLEVLEDRTLLSINPIVLENQKPGSPMSEWGIIGAGDPSIQGFATDISVNKGQAIGFKINTDSTNYLIDIYRLGYYQGLGARKIDSLRMRLRKPLTQPTPIVDSVTGLVDAGNWRTTVTWQVPSDAVSGIYFAKLTRLDGSRGASHIYFVVRDDTGRSDILMQTSDATWQAYNTWGGKSLYDYLSTGGQRAYKVSYNRPFDTRSRPVGDGEANFVFWAEYPMVRWLEANGYNVSYFTNVDTARYGDEIKEHKVFISVGHDEYWSAEMRRNVQAARDAGVHIMFLSGNNIYWKTRWEASLDQSGTPFRTLVSYKESLADAKIDPLTNVWTGLWRDPRFSPPADGGQPENALGGTIFTVNRGPHPVGTPIEVPYEYSRLRIWRHTDIQNLQPGEVASLGEYTLGYEWNEDLDNGFRPAGQIRLSSTTQQVSQKLMDYGKTVAPGTATHHLTLYRATSGALVFSAGTVQWAWGLDDHHDGPYSNVDRRIQQATVNLLADMGVQPATLQPGLVLATRSTDIDPPVAMFSTRNGATYPPNTAIVLSGTAADFGGGVVAGIEVSWDNGRTWHLAQGTHNWAYVWQPPGPGTYQIIARAIDDSVNIGRPTDPITIIVTSEDRTAPTISNVAAISGVNSAQIFWQTDEPANSIVLYGTDPNNLLQSVSTSDLVTNHILTLSNLDSNRTYYYRVASADQSGNRSWYPDLGTLSFRTAAFADDNIADFRQGTSDENIDISAMDNGEVTLKASLSADFLGSSLPGTFVVNSWSNNGNVAVADGVVSLDGAMIATSANYPNGTVLEFRARFSGKPYQHIGFATDLTNGPWLIFSTKEGNNLYARSFVETAIETPLGSQWLGGYHIFRIEYSTNYITYFIDGTLVAQHSVKPNRNLAVVASDYLAGGDTLDIDWLRISPYAKNGTYISRIFDASQRVLWDQVTWDALVFDNSSLDVFVRMGNTPNPDNNWTEFLPVSAPGSALPGTARYIQYKLVLTTNNGRYTEEVPVLRQIAFFVSPASLDNTPPTITSREPPPNTTTSTLRPQIQASFSELINFSSVTSDNVRLIHANTGVVIPTTLSVTGNVIRLQPNQNLIPATTYTVIIGNIKDLQGNEMASPDSWSFNTPTIAESQRTITHTTVSDFSPGQRDSIALVQDGDGALSLTPSLQDTFSSGDLSPTWSTTAWQSNGTATVSSGKIALDGSALWSTLIWPPGQFAEAHALFTGAAYQHLGFVDDLMTPRWAIFSTGTGGTLYARTATATQTIDTPIPGHWFGQYHTYRIEWLTNQVLYYIDGNLVAKHTLSLSNNLRFAVSDYINDGNSLLTDWVRAGKYAPSGTFTSAVLDAGSTVAWTNVQWSADVPANTTLQVYLRAGPTPNPDASWSTFVSLGSSNSNPALIGRYAQYRIFFVTNDPLRSPRLDDISLTVTSPNKLLFLHTRDSDFMTGQFAGTLVTKRQDGELQLSGKLNDDFDGSVLNNQWDYTTWTSVGGGPATFQLNNGKILLGGSGILSQAAVGLTVVQGAVAFTSTGYQNFGLATGLSDPRDNVWALFGTSPDGSRLLARINIFGSVIDRDLGPVPNGIHKYRIVPLPSRVDFYLDDALVASLNISLPPNVPHKVVLSDFFGTRPLLADWIEVAGYQTTGTYTSTVLDAGRNAAWGVFRWSGALPTGTSLLIETRSGNSPVPDSSWSSWSALHYDGTIASPPARYLQYRIMFLSTDFNHSPVLDALTIEYELI